MNKTDNSDFFNNLDDESLAKQIFTAYYFDVYLRIIEATKNKYHNNNRVVYLDFFAGPGMTNDGLELTPLKVVESFSKRSGILDNSYLYFNDLYKSELLSNNLKKKISNLNVDISYKVDNRDARTIEVTSLYKPTDIVLSFIDSFGFMMADILTVKKLTENKYSDCIVFINLKRIDRFVDAPNEKKNFVSFFGSEENYYHFKTLFKTKNRDECLEEVVKDYCKRLTIQNHSLLLLPIFFRLGDEETHYSHVIIVVSKSAAGINAIREAFTEVDDEIDNEGLKNKDFYLITERIVVFRNRKRGQMTLLGEDKEKFYKVLEYIPDNENEAINLDNLLNEIDTLFDNTNYYYYSGYSKMFLRRALRLLENENRLSFIQKEGKKRRQQTFGENTYFYKNENN